MKYTVSNKVHGFRYKNQRYGKGQVVDIPEGENVPTFLIPVGVKITPVIAVTPEADSSYEATPTQVEVEKQPKANLAESVEELDTPPEPKRVRRLRNPA